MDLLKGLHVGEIIMKNIFYLDICDYNLYCTHGKYCLILL